MLGYAKLVEDLEFIQQKGHRKVAFLFGWAASYLLH